MFAGTREASSIASVLLMTGCATAGSASYDAMQADYAHDSAQVRSAQAKDDQALAGNVLQRAAFVRAVLDRNLSIESARQAWRAAIAQAHATGSFDDPMVELSAAPLSIGSSSARFGWELAVSQHLPWFGKRGLESSVAAAEAQAAKSDFEATRRELAMTASTLFDQYFVVVRSLEINREHVELMRAMRAGATAQFEVGRASAQDPLQAEAELTHMEHDALLLDSQRDVVVAQMNDLLHRDPELALPPPPKDLPNASDVDRDAQRLEADAVEHRPDIESARVHARAEQARADRAERDGFPDVTLSTSYNSMWDTPQHRWMAGVGFNVPLQIERRNAQAEAARASRARYESEAARMASAARTQVVVALKQLDESRHVLHIYEERLLPVARDQVDAARAGFIASQNPFVAVVDAEKNLRSVELEYQMARAGSDRRRAELDRALGRIPGLDEQGGGQ